MISDEELRRLLKENGAYRETMKFEKYILVEVGNGECLELAVRDADSFEQCDDELSRELTRLDLDSKMVKEVKK